MTSDSFFPQAEFDFHELGPLTHFDIEKYLNTFLEDSYNEGHTRVLVITGKGLVVRPLVQKLLKNHALVEKYTTAGYHNGQSGAFEVWLVDEIE